MGMTLGKLYSEYKNPSNADHIHRAELAEFPGELRTEIPSSDDGEIYRDSFSYSEWDSSVLTEAVTDQSSDNSTRLTDMQASIALRFSEFAVKAGNIFPKSEVLYYFYMRRPKEAKNFIKSLNPVQARYLLFFYFHEWSEDQVKVSSKNRIEKELFYRPLGTILNFMSMCKLALFPLLKSSTYETDSE